MTRLELETINERNKGRTNQKLVILIYDYQKYYCELLPISKIPTLNENVSISENNLINAIVKGKFYVKNIEMMFD